jgi:hypothetical protein
MQSMSRRATPSGPSQDTPVAQARQDTNQLSGKQHIENRDACRPQTGQHVTTPKPTECGDCQHAHSSTTAHTRSEEGHAQSNRKQLWKWQTDGTLSCVFQTDHLGSVSKKSVDRCPALDILDGLKVHADLPANTVSIETSCGPKHAAGRCQHQKTEVIGIIFR